jgi:excisionase family DNA binding protein
MSTTPTTEAATGAELVDVNAVAELLGCSATSVRRMSEAGAMPAPVRLRTLVRWRRAELTAWLAAGCPRRTAEGGAR